MSRRVNSVAKGKPQNTPIGRVVGPYIVTGYVGDNPKGLYVTIGCPDCGHSIPPQARGHINVKADKCRNCGRPAPVKERLNDNSKGYQINHRTEPTQEYPRLVLA